MVISPTKRNIIFIILLVLVMTGSVISYEVWKFNLRFSTTQAWDKEVLAITLEKPRLVGNKIFSIEIPPPPHNLSPQVKKELNELHQLENERTEEKIREIKQEMSLMTTVLGTSTFAQLTDNRPKTKQLIGEVLTDFDVLLITKKEYYDRVRPHKLDTSLTTVIDVPGHPAYPSGHASQSWLFAKIFGKLDPVNAELYLESARRIARNREIAGVHYPSDSEAGRLLADKYFVLLEQDADYKKLFDEATTEWK